MIKKDKKTGEKNSKEPEQEKDMVFEEDPESNLKDSEEVIKKLRQKLKVCEEEKDKYLNDLYRAKADFLNLQKREREDNQKLISLANEKIIKDIIPAVESFNMAFSNKEAWENVPKEWRTGVEYIYNQLMSALANNSLEEINPEGEDFNPSFHDAVESIEVKEESEDQKIKEVVQKGYVLNGKVIKTAKVKIGEFKKESS